MSIKTILVPLDGGKTSLDVLDTALVVAKRFNAHIAALHISESALTSSTYANISSNLKESILREERQSQDNVAREIRNHVESFAKRRRITFSDNPAVSDKVSVSFSHEHGDVNDVLVRWARYHDTAAVCRPQTTPGKLRIGKVGSSVESLMMESGKPILMVPPNWVVKKAQHAVIAWNDSLEASKALSMTLPWLLQMKKVTIVVAKSRIEGGEKVRTQLAWHGIDAQVQVLNRRGQSAGKRLLKICKNIEADFLVMGAFSHSRVKQRLFGGVTDYVLENANILTVMVH